MRFLAGVALVASLAGCGAAHTAKPSFSACPAAPKPPPSVTAKKPTPKQISALEILVELWAEKLLARGDDCDKAVVERDKWIANHP